MRIPSIPFEGYKWYWATKTPSEGLNDPAVFFGVARIIRELSKREGFKYSGSLFADKLVKLRDDIPTSHIKVEARGGERNLIRNSGQYWKLLGIIPQDHHSGQIEITEFGRKITDGEISQTEFAATIIASFELPNSVSYNSTEINKWKTAGLTIHPFHTILGVLQILNNNGQGWITPAELRKIIVPAAGDKRDNATIAQHILEYRSNPSRFSSWPDCCTKSNDARYLREYLLFLYNYGFVGLEEATNKQNSRFIYFSELDDLISELIDGNIDSLDRAGLIKRVKEFDAQGFVSGVICTRRSQRPGQAKFRKELLETIGHCPITNVDLPEVLEAAHIKPHKYNGPETIDNGWPMRVDIHRLFDCGKLRIRPDGEYGRIEIMDDQAKENYRSLQGIAIVIPKQTNQEYLKWRYENYMIGMRADN